MLNRISDVDLRLLRVFVAVVEAGGFSLATARLNVAESTISSHMSDLEARLGMRLCERGRGGFRLTKRGAEVHSATLELLDQIDRFREHLALVNARVGGVIRLGVADGIIGDPVLDIAGHLGRVSDEHQDAHLEIVIETSRRLEQQLLNEEIHVAITSRHRPIAGLDFHDLHHERNLVYCGNKHPLFDKDDDAITIEMMEAASPIARGYIERFDEAFFRPESHHAVVYQIEAAAMLILSGRHIGFLPMHYAQSYVDKGQMRPLKQDEIVLDVPFSVAVKRSRAGNPTIVSLLACFLETDETVVA